MFKAIVASLLCLSALLFTSPASTQKPKDSAAPTKTETQKNADGTTTTTKTQGDHTEARTVDDKGKIIDIAETEPNS